MFSTLNSPRYLRVRLANHSFRLEAAQLIIVLLHFNQGDPNLISHPGPKIDSTRAAPPQASVNSWNDVDCCAQVRPRNWVARSKPRPLSFSCMLHVTPKIHCRISLTNVLYNAVGSFSNSPFSIFSPKVSRKLGRTDKADAFSCTDGKINLSFVVKDLQGYSRSILTS